MNSFITTNTTAKPSLSIFERAKQRIFGKNNTAAASTASRSHDIEGQGIAALLTREYQEHRQAEQATAHPTRETIGRIPEPIKKATVATMPQPPTSRKNPGKFATEDTGEMVACLTGKKTCSPDKLPKFRAELEHRGMLIEETPPMFKSGKPTIKVFCSAADFREMSNQSRNEFMSAGGGIKQGGSQSTKADESPTAIASSRRLKFPVQPPPGPTAAQFEAYSKEKVDAYAEKTKQRETGVLARIHIFDAFCSLGPASWRYEGPPMRGFGAAKPDTRRDAFFRKFRASLTHCNEFGPRSESPNNPPPPILPDAKNADFFLGLSEKAQQKMKQLMGAEHAGRNVRAELKRACEMASDAMQQALLADWEFELRSFPDEWIWPPVG